jgi:hypothetical protein
MKIFVVLIILFVTCSVLLFPSQVKAQIFINEFLASNTGSTVDPDYKESADWIELYNSGPSAVNIGGFYLSDNFNEKQKWQIPEGYIN